MTKLQQLKKDIGFTKVLPSCLNCEYYKSEELMNDYSHWVEKNIRCSLHNFATKKMSICNSYAKVNNV